MSRKKSSAHLPDAASSLLIGAAVLLALDVGRRIFRRSQLFEPERQPVISWNPEDYGIPRERTEVLNFETDDGELLYGWYCRAQHPIASALYCHGNTGNLSNTAHVMPHLLDAGINVLLFDYRGFGRSSGSPSLSGIIDDGVTAARLHEKIRPKNIPSILYGYSLGGAIAAQIIRRHPFDGLILQSTFTNLPDIARVTFPRVPLHLVSGRLFDTLEVVRNLTIPALIIHGTTDEVCPSWMAQQLHDSCATSEKKLILVEGGLHKDLFERDDAQTLVWEINRFATSLRCTPHVVQYQPGAGELLLDHALRFVRRQWRRHLVQQPL
ncbi:MAG TPA: alpha/beta fold hydrolase [Thermoanaerobaculia bacterium]|nr:alpha/beta fold hydrolase [Thermoanaerobaculia bacterium]